MYNNKTGILQYYIDIDDKYNLVPLPEIEVETWTPKKEIKNEKDKSFYLHQQLQQILQKTFPKHLRAKAEGNTRSKQKLKLGSSKIKENHNQRKPKKMKDTEAENVFKDTDRALWVQ